MAAPKKKKTRSKKKAAWWPRLKKKLSQPGVLLFAAGITLGVALVVAGLLLFGPQSRTPDGRLILERSHADRPAAKAASERRKRPEKASPARRTLPAVSTEMFPTALCRMPPPLRSRCLPALTLMSPSKVATEYLVTPGI